MFKRHEICFVVYSFAIRCFNHAAQKAQQIDFFRIYIVKKIRLKVVNIYLVDKNTLGNIVPFFKKDFMQIEICFIVSLHFLRSFQLMDQVTIMYIILIFQFFKCLQYKFLVSRNQVHIIKVYLGLFISFHADLIFFLQINGSSDYRVSIAQQWHCQHQNCLTLALVSISIAQHQNCLALELAKFLIW